MINVTVYTTSHREEKQLVTFSHLSERNAKEHSLVAITTRTQRCREVIPFCRSRPY